MRATAIAQLIKSFCASSVLDAFDIQPAITAGGATAQLLEADIEELLEIGSAGLSDDRQTLLGMYELLLLQKLRFEQREFFASSHEDVIANHVTQLAEERLQREQQP